MLYLIWGLINIALFLYLLITGLRVAKLLKQRLGLITSLMFVFGMLSFVSHAGDDNDSTRRNSSKIENFQFYSEDSLDRSETFLVKVELEKTMISKIQFFITYGKDKQKILKVPISASSFTTGFVSGTKWKPLSITVNKTNDNDKFDYLVDGVMEWKLFNITVYTERKEFKGSVITS